MRVFISYARHDREFANALAGELGRNGIDAWIDIEGIPGGSSWQSEIQLAIESSDSVIALISASSNASRYVQAEVIYAQGLKKRVIPVLLEADVRLPIFLVQLQYVDASQTTNRENAIRALVKALRGSESLLDPDALPPPQEELSNERKRVEENIERADRVFIAYARPQRSIAASLSDLLYRNSKPNFYDAKIHAGARWRQTIQKALDDCTHLVVVWTPEAAGSDEVEREVSYALSEGKIIIPLLSKEIPKLPYHLHGLHYLVIDGEIEALEADIIKAFERYKQDDVFQ